jgi:hypothetical protein
MNQPGGGGTCHPTRSTRPGRRGTMAATMTTETRTLAPAALAERERVRRIIGAHEAELDALPPAILDRALEGEL